MLMKKNACLIVLIVIISLIFTSCYDKLSDKNKHLYTVAVNNSINFHIDGEAPLRFQVIETDKYGRILFSFPAYYHNLCILQKSDEEYIYYYDDVCLIEYRDKSEITDDMIAKFKELNDWDCELNEEKMTKKPMEYPKNHAERKNLNKEAIESAVKKKFSLKDEDTELNCMYLTSNNTDLKLYFVGITKYKSTSQPIYNCYFVILNSDNEIINDNYIIEEDPENINCSETIKKLKERMNWYNNLETKV